MMSKKFKSISKIFSFAIIGLIIGSLVVSGYQGNINVKGPNYSEERYEAIQNSFDNLDYDKWYSLMTEDERNPGVLKFVNNDNFETFVNMRNAMISGDLNTANKLKEELGISNGNNYNKGFKNGGLKNHNNIHYLN